MIKAKQIIKSIVTNPYIGFALIIKELYSIADGLIKNLKFREIMDYNLIINLAVDLFIAIIIYNLLKIYKTKVTKEELQAQMESANGELQAQMESANGELQAQMESAKSKFDKQLEILELKQKLKGIYFSQSLRALFRISRNLSNGDRKYYKNVINKEEKYIYKFLFHTNDENVNHYCEKLEQLDYTSIYNQSSNVEFILKYLSSAELNKLGITNSELETIHNAK